MTKCVECQLEIKETDANCPNCGTPNKPTPVTKNWGFEYKSNIFIMGLPLIHISFGFKPTGRPIPAKGIIAIGQFAIGIISFSQFGIGVLSLSQFTIAGYAVAQFAFAYDLVAQVGVYINSGKGQVIWNLKELLM